MQISYRCPRCGHACFWIIRRHHRKCRTCRTEWSPRLIFPVPSFRIARHAWKNILDAFLRDGSANAIVRECRLSLKTAQSCATAIRLAMGQDIPKKLFGVCEADETYIGGAWKNKKIHIRKTGSKRGRGTSKQAIFGIVSRTEEKVRVWLVPNAKIRTTRPKICRTVNKGGAIYTDGFKGYRTLSRYGYVHDFVDHEAGEYVRGAVHTQTLDGYWGLLKNWLAAKGGVRRKYLCRFVEEHVWRYNFRNLSRKEQVNRLFKLLAKFGGRN